ncbi:hypothetical protein GIB67_000717 [Kingdonia uniflora]|uniref:UDP-glycosyltransferase n=1 Tax=Kingdonia uniflora TaxID=39325 RepID=A0A7J7NDH4_9MAGN|nr:hypothetical protein GIB67_000717 [Kingdonia uniflora]
MKTEVRQFGLQSSNLTPSISTLMRVNAMHMYLSFVNISSSMGNPHALVIPYPVQGHVIPFMELSHSLVERGFKVTFVNTEFNHKRIVATLRNNRKDSQIRLVSIPDGFGPDESRNNIVKLCHATQHIFPGELEKLITMINRSDDDDDVTCVISDMGAALEVAEKMEIKRAVFWTMSAANVAFTQSVEKLIDMGIIDHDGRLMKNQMIQLSPTMPAINPANFIWLCIGDAATQKQIFEIMVNNNKAQKVANWLICNSSYGLEPAAFELIPNILPIGPLFASSQLEKPEGHFWAEDVTCLNWLNQQPDRSVIYVAFGSITIFDKTQFQELAMGLELSGQPFLWVVRPDFINGLCDTYPDGYQARVGTRGKIVEWAPQQNVLAHPSISCFVSHCGWNSTMEAVSNGVRFLCWPYYADQFLNQSYICDVWRVGTRLTADDSGIIRGEEIKEKVKKLLGDEEIKIRISELMIIARKSVIDGGDSSINLDKFVDNIKQ